MRLAWAGSRLAATTVPALGPALFVAFLFLLCLMAVGGLPLPVGAEELAPGAGLAPAAGPATAL